MKKFFLLICAPFLFCGCRESVSCNKIYLSDVPLTLAKNTPPLNSCAATSASISGKSFSNAIRLNSRSKLIWRLDGAAELLQCVVGCDDERKSLNNGNIVFKIYCDGVEKFNSGILRPGMPPVSVVLSLKNVKQLELAVEEGDDGTNNDNAVWADAIIQVIDKRKLLDAATKARLNAEKECVKYDDFNWPEGKTQGKLKTEKINYKGWENAYKLSNGIIELVVVPSLSGRIMRYSFVNGENIIYSNQKEYGKVYNVIHGRRYLMYGGHVAWLGPSFRCWPPDAFLTGGKCNVEIPAPGKIKLTGLKSYETNVRFTKEIEILPDGSSVKIVQTMENILDFPVEWNIWNNTRVKAKNACVWFPVHKNGRYKGIVKCQPELLKSGQAEISNGIFYVKSGNIQGKIFSDSHAGWIAYRRNGLKFMKKFGYFPKEKYSKEDGIVEIYLGSDFIELENHSPLKRLKPGEKYSYKEIWTLKNIQMKVIGRKE